LGRISIIVEISSNFRPEKTAMDENGKPKDQTTVQGETKKTWTVMVYLAGDNNLTSNCITVLQQLEAVKYTKEVRVLACFDSNTPWPKGSRYLAINGKRRTNDKDLDWEIYNDLIITEKRGHTLDEFPDSCLDKKPQGQSMKRTAMKRTDVAEGLKRFLKWAIRKHGKTDHYMLVLYGHGPVVAGKTFLARDNPASFLRMKDLSKLLAPYFKSERKLDILAFQNCAMNGIETAYELKDQVDYMIGSQGLVLAYGWPYERIISALVDNLKDPPIALAQKFLKACARHLMDFSVMDRSSEQSVCDLNRLNEQENLTTAIGSLSQTLQGALGFTQVPEARLLDDKDQLVLEFPVICDAVRIARLEAQSYWGETFVDVYDFCERLMKKCNESIVGNGELIERLSDLQYQRELGDTELMRKLNAIVECCRDVLRAVEAMVKYSYYIGSDLQYSHGLSIYFPWTMQQEPYTFYFRRKKREHALVNAFETYSGFAFAEDSGWAAFLRKFYLATLRKVRRADRKFDKKENKAAFSAGVVRESHTGPDEFLVAAQLQKTDSNTGINDYDVWSNVKNYPRRNYLSPSDCPRKLEEPGRYLAGTEFYPNLNSPPVSYLGWNVCEFVADVIKRKDNGTNGDRNQAKKEVSAQQNAAQELAKADIQQKLA
jgi:hypothetical protein